MKNTKPDRTIDSELARARELAEEKRWPEVKTILDRVRARLAEDHRDSADVCWFAGVAADYNHQFEEAIGLIRRARALDPYNPQYAESETIVYDRIRTVLMDEDRNPNGPGVERLYALLCRDDRADKECHLTMARHLQQTGQIERALVLASALTVLHPQCTESWRLRIELTRSRDGEPAAAALEELAAEAQREGEAARPRAVA
jgi:tetratricopeptide (TPR) repeat protein